MTDHHFTSLEQLSYESWNGKQFAEVEDKLTARNNKLTFETSSEVPACS